MLLVSAQQVTEGQKRYMSDVIPCRINALQQLFCDGDALLSQEVALSGSRMSDAKHLD
jgi:hypothetical protein